ncbi:hypothetical protein ASD36_29565 [Rhizobium sp. Root1334]|nr:hypothetical protein ASD36_29565 [Rhizobium sp. Root1334]
MGNLPRPENAFTLSKAETPAAVGSVAIHCHVFYLSLFPELCTCLADLTFDFSLYVTVCKEADVEAARRYAQEKLPDNIKVEVRLVPNKGRDIGPLFVGLADIIEKHDVWCHLHTKYSPHTEFGGRWRTYLIDQLIGSDARVNDVLSLLEPASPFGLIYPQNYFEIKKYVNHGSNRNILEHLFQRIGIKTAVPDQLEDFAAGSMCWFKTSALKPIIDAKFDITEFGEEASQVDGTLAHSLERALCLVPDVEGFKVGVFFAPTLRVEMLRNPATCAIEDRELVGQRWLRDTPAISISPPLPLHAPPAPVNSASLSVHWVIPDFGPGAGGHTTIFRFVKMFDDAGFRQTIWIQNAFNHRFPATAKAQIVAWYTSLSEQAIVRFLTDDVEAISGDVVIATDCWTAYPVSRMTRFAHRFYFIQDWESEFHPAGELRFTALATYDFGFTALTAGKWLETKARSAGMETFCWYLGADRDIYTPLENPRPRISHGPVPTGNFFASDATGENINLPEFFPIPQGDVRSQASINGASIPHIAFYARAYTPRRAVRLGLEALDVLAKRGWRFHVDFFGENIDFGQKPYSFTPHGVLKPAELADIYRSSDIGLVFSSTNYSLVPLEMMACSLPVLEVDTESTRVAYPDEAVYFAAPTVYGVVNALEDMLSRPEQLDILVANAHKFLETADWERSGRIVADAIRTKVRESGAPDIAPLVARLEAENRTRLSAPALHRKPQASVFIPTYNAGPEFATVLDALAEQKIDGGYELVIIDSGSTDETLDLIRTRALRQRIVLHSIPSSQFGHGKTRNAGIDMASADVVAILTQDACPTTPHWLDRLVGGFDAGSKVAGVFGRHVAYPLHELFEGEPLKAMFDRFKRLGALYAWDRELPGFVERGSPAWQYHLQFYSDNNSCLRKSVWREVPYADVPWGEDMIWAAQIIQLGFEKAYVDEAAVYHSHDYAPRKLLEVGEQEGRMFLKHFGMRIVPEVKIENQDQVAWDMAKGQATQEALKLAKVDANTPLLTMRRALQHAALIRGRMSGARAMGEILRE